MTPPGEMTNGAMNGGPWWVRFIYMFGIPAGLSVYLIWLMAGRLEAKIDNLGMYWATHVQETAYAKELTEEQTRRIDDVYRAMVQICVNTAANQADRNACFGRPPVQ